MGVESGTYDIDGILESPLSFGSGMSVYSDEDLWLTQDTYLPARRSLVMIGTNAPGSSSASATFTLTITMVFRDYDHGNTVILPSPDQIG